MEVDEQAETDMWADENLDEEIKDLLSSEENGKQLPLDMVAHCEYFYNTLDCNFKTQNPFEIPHAFPALSFRDQSSNLSIG
jgi:hypothetical protein